MGRLYDSIRWRQLRAVKLARSPMCEECLTMGRDVPATDVDHVVAIANGGGALDLANLRSLCRKCHSRKTAEMDRGFGNARRQRMRVRGCTPDGLPRDPAHPWAEESRDRDGQTPRPPLSVRFPGF